MVLFKKTCMLLTGAAMTLSGLQAGDFKLSDKLSISGFIDMSYFSKDVDNGVDSDEAAIDQFEIDFMYDFGKGFSAQVDIEAQSDNMANGGNEYTVDLEQAFFVSQLSDAFSLKAGRFLSYSGWETEEPTGLFQYSGTGYGQYFYGGYQQGLSVKYSSELFEAGLSAVDDLAGSSGNAENIGIEAMLAVYPVEGFTLKGFYLTDDVVTAAGTYSTSMVNLWASYAVGGLTLAAEYNMADDLSAIGKGSEATGFLLMGNYAWEKIGLTLRYHGWETENAAGAAVEDVTGFTISPSYAVNDYLLLVAEYRTEDFDKGGSDYDQIALEALVSF